MRDRIGALRAAQWEREAEDGLRLQPPLLGDGHQRRVVQPDAALPGGHRGQHPLLQRKHRKHAVESRGKRPRERLPLLLRQHVTPDGCHLRRRKHAGKQRQLLQRADIRI